MLSALVMTCRSCRFIRLRATSVVVEPASRMIVSPSSTSAAAVRPMRPLGVHVDQMMQGQRLDLLRHGGEKGAAVLADDVALGLKPLEILPDGRFGNLERLAQHPHAGTTLFLQPVEDAPPARLGEQRAAAPPAPGRRRA